MNLGNKIFGKIINGCPLLQYVNIIDYDMLSELIFTAPGIKILGVYMDYDKFRTNYQLPQCEVFLISWICTSSKNQPIIHSIGIHPTRYLWC